MKSAIYIEQKIRKGEKKGQIIGWAGYIYSEGTVNEKDFIFVKEATDQYYKPVKVYKATETTHFEHPGGVAKTNLVVLY